MNKHSRSLLKEALFQIREALSEDTVTIDLELPDDLALFVLQECARRNISPNELIEEAVEIMVTELEPLNDA